MKNPTHSTARGARSVFGSSHLTVVLGLAAAALVATPFATSLGDFDPLENLPHANEGAFEGGPTGTASDAGINNAVPEDQQTSFNIPTNSLPSPMFGAGDWEQKMLRFEEFGPQPMPTTYAPGSAFPPPLDAQSGPDTAALDAFMVEPLYPPATREANDADMNPWQPEIEGFLGRALDTPPAEGRPAGEDWAHQRWAEFQPVNFYKTVMAGARQNSGFRDVMQLHGYTAGEFGPGGLYHDTTGAGTNGTTAGIDIRFHPNMPIQTQNALWCFDGTLPPKLLNVRYGEPLVMRHYNALPIDPAANRGFGLHTISTHEHNGHTPAESDGYTNAFFFPGQYYDYRWPIQLAGHDSINTDASDPRAGRPDGNGGITQIRGDWRETMSTHWFHDHMLDFTAQNVYKGNAAMMNYYSAIDRGNEAIDDGVNLRLPSGTAMDWGNRDYDVNLLVADKAWDQTGQLWFNIFNLDGFLGDRLLTNWLWRPTFDVRARKYRFRILNGSVSRYIKVALVTEEGTRVPFHLIGNDGNIMEHSIHFNGIGGVSNAILPEQGIAERWDIIVDFSQFEPGQKLYFVNVLEHDDGKGPKQNILLESILDGTYNPTIQDGEWVGGDPCVGKFLELVVQPYDGVDLSMDPSEYEPGGKTMIPLRMPTAQEIASAPRRHFEFGRSSGTDGAPWTVKTDGGAGLTMDPRRISASPQMAGNATHDQLEIWTIENGTGGGWAHPVHIHFEEGIVLSRDGAPPPPWERWARKDLYRIGDHPDSSREVEVAIRFREFAGTYMEHCHNTQHEDHAMLFRWDNEHPGQMKAMPAPIPTWDGVEFVNSMALPTAGSVLDILDPGSLGLNDVGQPHPEDGEGRIIVKRSVHKKSTGTWRVVGNTQGVAPGTLLVIHAGSDKFAPVVGTATVLPNGKWRLLTTNSPVTTDYMDMICIQGSDGSYLYGQDIKVKK